MQTELALDDVTYRGLQTQKTISTDTIAAYAKALDITTNLYNAGSVSKADVLQAETSLRNALANAADVDNQIAALEHAIAVLSGDNPTSFDLPDSQAASTTSASTSRCTGGGIAPNAGRTSRRPNGARPPRTPGTPR